MVLRCKTCGITTPRFHGWVFAAGKCFTPGVLSSTHDWELVEPEKE